MKLKKRKKRSRMHGRGMGTHGWGARKKHLGNGHRGGYGMAGTGKRADHKKSLVIKLYGNNYFGKQGVTSKSTKKDKSKVINLDDLEKTLESLKKHYWKEKEKILDLKEYKILGRGEIKSKINIKVRSVSEEAKKKLEEAGCKLILEEKKESKEGN